MKFLDPIKKKGGTAGHDSLRYHLHKQLAGHDKARPNKNVHASELMKKDQEFCPREKALLDILKKERPDEFVSAPLRKVFDDGNIAANWLVHKLGDIGVVVGDWECHHCAAKYEFQKRPLKCTGCQHKFFKYHERRFKSLTTDIGCGVDIFFLMQNKKLRVVEAKTIKDDDFKKLEAPLAEHKWRTNLYLRIIEDSNSPLKDRIDLETFTVFYMCKGGFGRKDEDLRPYGITDGEFSPFLEYNVKRNDKLTDVKWAHAKRLFEFRKGLKGIPLGLCPTGFCARAQVCSVKDACFSGKFKGEV